MSQLRGPHADVASAGTSAHSLRVSAGPGSERNLVATIVEAKVVNAILDALGLESAPPAVRPSRGPPDCEMVERGVVLT